MCRAMRWAPDPGSRVDLADRLREAREKRVGCRDTAIAPESTWRDWDMHLPVTMLLSWQVVFRYIGGCAYVKVQCLDDVFVQSDAAKNLHVF